jgi:endonuclease/exonuclease/phosphatase family metal-dependent hydrolase
MLAGCLINPRGIARRVTLTLALAAAAIGGWAMPAAAPAQATTAGKFHFPRISTLRVMTRNLYLGADLTPALSSQTPAQFFAANGAILRQVTRTNFPVRAKGLADEILGQRPDLVGLQEVALWRTAAPSLTPVLAGPSATTVRYDFLQLLLNRLNQHHPGLYRAVVVQPEFDFEAPADENGQPNDGPDAATGGLLKDAEINGRLTMRDVILARRGTFTTNPQSGHFSDADLLKVTVSGIPITVTRGWTSVDAIAGHSGPFHFVNTHLEAFDDETEHPSVRARQAAELVAPGGPARSTLPVILVGDLNSDVATEVKPGDAQAYQVMLDAGFRERSTSNPLSCCIHDPDLMTGTAAEFDHQVDHIMTSSPLRVLRLHSTVTGRQMHNGLWDSDHAGLASLLLTIF